MNLLFKTLSAQTDSTPEQEKFLALTSELSYIKFLPHSRTVDKFNPFNISVTDKHRMPLGETTTQTYAEIVDNRAAELANQLEVNNLPIYVLWSGGIDSTVALSAIIKNFTTTQLKQVHVIMNNLSYTENPYFYENFIKDKIAVVNYIEKNFTDSILVDGNPADTIWTQADIVEMEHIQACVSGNDIYKDPDFLIKWLSKKTTPQYGRWTYELVLECAELAGIRLETYEDFYWWFNFDFFYPGNTYQTLEYTKVWDWESYQANNFSFFDSVDFQRWSQTNRNNGVKIVPGNISSYKMEAKNYIYDLDKNYYYRKYKTKTGSIRTYSRAPAVTLYNNGQLIIGSNSYKPNFKRIPRSL